MLLYKTADLKNFLCVRLNNDSILILLHFCHITSIQNYSGENVRFSERRCKKDLKIIRSFFNATFCLLSISSKYFLDFSIWKELHAGRQPSWKRFRCNNNNLNNIFLSLWQKPSITRQKRNEEKLKRLIVIILLPYLQNINQDVSQL